MLSLWQMSLSASLIILLTALLRHAAANRLPRRMYIALWDVALLASLVPYRVPWEALSRLLRRAKEPVIRADGAVFSAPSQTPYLAQDFGMPVSAGTAAATPSLPAPTLGGGVRDELTQAIHPLRETLQTAPDWLWQAFGILWIIGVIALAAVLLYRWALCLRVFSEAFPCEDGRVADFLREHRLMRSIRVRVSRHVSSPLSYGLLRPVILLPAAMADADDQTLGYVLTHEFMHIRAWDMLRKWTLLLALCLHWFNPLAWVMLRLYSRDMELMCDERVVRLLGGRKAYCLTLLDMEVQRSNLTMGTCFSVTGIEERIQVMKNRKHQGILSIALAFAIFLGAAVGAMTGIPLADAENASPKIFFSRETWENSYAQYEPYGLAYDGENGTITFDGQVVRYFEDMWPVDEQGKAGTCFMYEDGDVDVYSVREYGEYIQRNPDGSFDPSGTLVGLRKATPEESAELTARMKVNFLNQGATTEYLTDYQVVDAAVLINGADPAYTGELKVVWWTADEYREWLENERRDLQQLVDEQVRAWTPSRGWFTWTQELADEAIARYEEILDSIEQGAFVSRTINSEDANMTLIQDLRTSILSSVESQSVWSTASDVPPVEGTADDAVVEDQAVSLMFSSTLTDTVLQVDIEPDMGSDATGKVVLVAVSPDDEWRYPPEQWAKIHELIELGVIQWQEPSTAEDLNTAMLSYQDMRSEEWRRTIAPYVPFGLSYALDTTTDIIHLYWNGKEVRGVFDPERGLWITEHAGNSHYPDGAKELIAVYEDGKLAGLREADEEENAVWDKLRRDNSKQ